MTPKLLSNIVQSLEEAEMEMGEIDGFDELSEENQEKVLKAAEQGHVEDEDWNGVCFFPFSFILFTCIGIYADG